MTGDANDLEFGWSDARQCGSHAYLVPRLMEILSRRIADPGQMRLIDIGCGNGAVTSVLSAAGYQVIGVDPARDGIAQARAAFPELRVEIGSVYDNLAERFGAFDIVVSLEVVEHLYSPQALADNIARMLRPGGFAVLSTPYHGYFKNLALSIAGKWDFHHHPEVEHGHIKFWSRRTLERLMAGSGMKASEFHRLGRIPLLGKSMMLVFEKSR